jgi:hypothetical protein
MTRILLHPRRLPRYSGAPMLLPRPWCWWEARCSGEDEQVVMDYQPSWDNIQEATITFGPDGSRVTLTDPPAAVLLHLSRYQDDAYAPWGNPINRIMVTSSYLQARVVWHESPGPHWQPVSSPMPSCRVGEYRHDTVMEGERDRRVRRDDREFERSPAEGVLQWPMDPTLIDGVAVPPRNFPDRCRICERYIPVEGATGRELISGVCDECRDLRAFREYEATRRLTREEIQAVAERVGYTPAQIEAMRGGFRTERLNQWAQSGAMSINEIREREGLPPLPEPQIPQTQAMRGPLGAEIMEDVLQAPPVQIWTPGCAWRRAYDEVIRSSRRLPAGDFDRQRQVDLDHPDRFYPGDPRNPEQNVLDAIEELVNEQLAHPEDFHTVGDRRACPNCGGSWHGLVGDGPAELVSEGHPGAESYRQVRNGGMPGCPGSTASAKEVRKWRKRQ